MTTIKKDKIFKDILLDQITEYHIWNENKQMYAGPMFSYPVESNKLTCNWSLHVAVNCGFRKDIALSFLASLQKTHPRTAFSLHKYDIKLTKVPLTTVS